MSKPGISLRASVSQQQTMTPQLLQSIRLLQLSALELELEVRNALDSNVMLEADEEEADETATATDAGSDTLEAQDKVSADFDSVGCDSWTSGGGSDFADEDGEHWSQRLAAPERSDPQVEVLEQLDLYGSDDAQASRIVAVLEQIDDNGYLRTSLESLAVASGVTGTPAEWLQALRFVQMHGPAGYGARDLRECLQLQLVEMPVDFVVTLASRIVSEALERIPVTRAAALADELDVDAGDLAEALALIRSLDPKPGARAQPAADTIVPDVVVYGRPGDWHVELNPETLPRVRVNRSYEAALAQAPGAHRALKDQASEARWLIRGLEMRHETLLKTAQAIFCRQLRFLEQGEAGVAPLRMLEVAERIGMHESTVCRVSASKYVETPWGIYPLKAFFATQIAGRNGETSNTAVRAIVRRMVETEDATHPLSDGAIADRLSRQGINIARRTVAKYRDQMQIPSANLRQSPVAELAEAA